MTTNSAREEAVLGLREGALAVGIGVLAGLGSGLLGVGGGIVMVPLLRRALDFSQHRAHATSLAAIVPIAAVGAARFAIDGRVSYVIALLLAAGALVGAPLGARLMARAGEGALTMMFGCLMVIVAVQVLWP